MAVGAFSPGAREELVGGASWYTNFCDEKGEWRAPATKLNAATAITSTEALLLKVAEHTVKLDPSESLSDATSGEALLLKTADKMMTLNPSEMAPDVIPLPMESGPTHHRTACC